MNEDNRCGGRGVCRYCGEVHNNVAYHQSSECSKRPDADKYPPPSYPESRPMGRTAAENGICDLPPETSATKYKPCPFCGAKGELIGPDKLRLRHASGCFLANYKFLSGNLLKRWNNDKLLSDFENFLEVAKRMLGKNFTGYLGADDYFLAGAIAMRNIIRNTMSDNEPELPSCPASSPDKDVMVRYVRFLDDNH